MKNKVKIMLAFILGLVISGISVYALNIAGRDVSYDNTNSGVQATNVQGAVDELYTKINNSTAGAFNVIYKESYLYTGSAITYTFTNDYKTVLFVQGGYNVNVAVYGSISGNFDIEDLGYSTMFSVNQSYGVHVYKLTNVKAGDIATITHDTGGFMFIEI